jgi:hypothetical protein
MLYSCVVAILVSGKAMEAGTMFGKKKMKTPEEQNSICPICGLDCRDKLSLERHIDWVHKDQKNPIKS